MPADSSFNLTESSSPINSWQHPPSFYCPISQQCMHDPVVLSDGHTYERRHIERWLKNHNTSPVTGVRLAKDDIFPNHALRNAIQEYFQQVFSVHRRAITKTISGQGVDSNAALLRTIDALMQCSLLVSADLNTESVLRQIMDEAKVLIGAEVASVFLVDAATQELYSNVNSTGGELRIPITAGIAGHVATTGELVVIRDAYTDDRFSKAMDIKTGFRTRNMICAPLKVKNGGVFGVVQLINKVGDSPTAEGLGADPFGVLADEQLDADAAGFTADDVDFLRVFASQAATAIASSQGFTSTRRPSWRSSSPYASNDGTTFRLEDDEDETFASPYPSECDDCKRRDSKTVAKPSPPSEATSSTSAAEWRSESTDAGVIDALALAEDLAHLALPWDLHVRWVRSLEAAVLAQDGHENLLGLQKLFAADPGKAKTSDMHMGVLGLVALPMCSVLSRAAPVAEPILSAIAAECERWLAVDPIAEDCVQQTPSLRRKSGRTRQRLAKWKRSVRCRTPSP